MTKLLYVVVFGSFLACGGGGDTKSVAEHLESAPSSESFAYDEVAITEAAMPVSQLTIPTNPALEQEQKIIKTANLSFETVDPSTTHQKILTLVEQYKGFVASDDSGKSHNRIYRNMVVRVPTENFQAMIDAISEGVPYFEQKRISRQDVTEEFIDLEARLKAKKELEKRYLELLSKANNIKDMLEIERQLSQIREEIEARQGRLQYLQNRVSISTISIEFYKITAQSGITQSYGQKIKNALQGGWNGISVFFLGLLYLWPLFIILIIAILVIRWFLRRNKEKQSQSP